MAVSRSNNGQFRSKRRIVVDLTCLAVLAVLVLLLKHFGVPSHRGFYCDDDSIRYPKVDKQEVPTHLLYAVCYLLPIVVFVVVEVCQVFATCSPSDSCHSVSTGLLLRLCELYGCFLLGVCLEELSTDIGKFTIGRLRPHFLTVCDLQEDVCSKIAHPHTYMIDYECKGDTRKARVSFPSGHSALSFYTAVYLVIYLHYRLTMSVLSVPRHLIQAALLMVAYFTALSRVADYMHHPSDVVVGVLLGSFWAVMTTRLLIDMKTASRYWSEEVDQEFEKCSVSKSFKPK